MSAPNARHCIFPVDRNQYSLNDAEEEGCVLPVEEVPPGGMEPEADEGVEEAMAPHAARDPGEPSDAERKRHACTHLPSRSWCRPCVQGRGNNPPHSGAGHFRPHDVPEVVVDGCFPNKEEGGRALTVLATKDRAAIPAWPLHALANYECLRTQRTKHWPAARGWGTTGSYC